MKHQKFENLIEDLKMIKMSEVEKADVLSRALTSIDQIEAAHALSNGRVASLGSNDQSVTSTFQHAWYSYIFEKKFVPALSFAILLLGTGGTSIAAEQSLPGDLLYPVKININEQVRGFTAVTPEAKAKFALEITDRRLKEVAILSSQGRLNAETGAIIQGELLKQAGQIKNQVASLVSTNNIQAAQEISLNFESSLRAHELILEKISSDQADKENAVNAENLASNTDSSVSGSTTASSTGPMAASARLTLASAGNIHINSIIATLKTELATTTASRTTLQAKELSDDSADKDKVVARLAELRLKAMEIKRIASSTPVSPQRASTSLSYIYQSDLLISSANSKLSTSAYSDALAFIQKASQYLIDAETLITAGDDSDDNTKTDSSLNQVINDALSVPNFTTVDLSNVNTTTSSASSTSASSTNATASTTSSTNTTASTTSK